MIRIVLVIVFELGNMGGSYMNIWSGRRFDKSKLVRAHLLANERDRRIELLTSDWKSDVLPVN